jgi:hypothetical protein
MAFQSVSERFTYGVYPTQKVQKRACFNRPNALKIVADLAYAFQGVSERFKLFHIFGDQNMSGYKHAPFVWAAGSGPDKDRKAGEAKVTKGRRVLPHNHKPAFQGRF